MIRCKDNRILSLANKLLNWEPKVGREEGMKITFDYFKGLTQEELI